MSDVFNVKHPILYVGDSYNNNANLTANYLQLKKDNTGQVGFDFMKKLGEDICVRTRSKACPKGPIG
jgi:hypothetical protein